MATCSADSGSIALAVVVTLIVTLAIVALLMLLFYLLYWRPKLKRAMRGFHIVDEHQINRVGGTKGDGSKSGDGAYVNAAYLADGVASKGTVTTKQLDTYAELGFGGYVPSKDYFGNRAVAVPNGSTQTGVRLGATNNNGAVAAEPTAVAGRTTVLYMSPQAGVRGPRSPRATLKSRQSLDDSCISVDAGSPEEYVVAMKSNDPIGLGFNIQGSLSEGIFVSKINSRGPAADSGQIKIGDRLTHVGISFDNIVYEDAFTVLSYASPYPVQLRFRRSGASKRDSLGSGALLDADAPSILDDCRPHSQSMNDVSKILAGADGHQRSSAMI